MSIGLSQATPHLWIPRLCCGQTLISHRRGMTYAMALCMPFIRGNQFGKTVVYIKYILVYFYLIGGNMLFLFPLEIAGKPKRKYNGHLAGF